VYVEASDDVQKDQRIPCGEWGFKPSTSRKAKGVLNHAMGFGASPSDIIIVVTFCRELYRKCRDAGGEYDEISREVRGM
jgi:hypothetical protein